jgi:hypothetical protein
MRPEFHAQLARDMVLLDRAYLPALVMTEPPGDAKQADAALRTLEARWKPFRERYYDANPADQYWESDFDFIQLMLAEAADLIRGEAALPEAHEVLGGIRMVLRRLRRRNNMDYFIDHLTAFHGPLAAIVQAAREKTPESLTIDDVDTMRVWLPEALRLWEKATNHPPNRDLFGLDEIQLARVQTYIEHEYAALTHLQQTLAEMSEGVDEERIIQAALETRQPFLQLLMLFGDFEPHDEPVAAS